MLEMNNLDLKDSEVTPLSLIRDIAPRSMKVNTDLWVWGLLRVCWLQLKDQGRGEILISVCHQPAAARLTVVVLKARNLPKMDITGLSGARHHTSWQYSHTLHFLPDPYVKIYLLHKDQRISKKKTHVKKRTLNPVFNESFVFDLPRTENGLADVQLEFALLDWDRVTKNEVRNMIYFFCRKFSTHWNMYWEIHGIAKW